MDWFIAAAVAAAVQPGVRAVSLQVRVRACFAAR